MHVRPSLLLDVTDPWPAFCLDRAVDLFGGALEAAMREAAKGQKTDVAAERAALRVLNRWLESGDPAAPDAARPAARGAYRDPFADGLVG